MNETNELSIYRWTIRFISEWSEWSEIWVIGSSFSGAIENYRCSEIVTEAFDILARNLKLCTIEVNFQQIEMIIFRIGNWEVDLQSLFYCKTFLEYFYSSWMVSCVILSTNFVMEFDWLVREPTHLNQAHISLLGTTFWWIKSIWNHLL